MPDFVKIPSGEYIIDPSEEWKKRVHEVPIYDHFAETVWPQVETVEKPFYISRFPITNEEFEEVIPGHNRSLYGPNDKHPVTAITYYEALIYCQERGYRMPTRSEWLIAAVGNIAWTLANSETMDVSKINRFNPESPTHGLNLEGEYPPNPRGIYDMSGNVCEFNSPVIETQVGPNKLRVVMTSGGSWGSCKDGSTPYFYLTQDAYLRNDRVGLRVIKCDE